MAKRKDRDAPPRALFTDEQLAAMSGHELACVRLTDDEVRRLRAINDERHRQASARGVRLDAEQALLLAELRALGLPLRWLNDLDLKAPAGEAAAAVLLRHLQLPYSSATKAQIAHLLAAPVPAVRKAWPLLVREYGDARTGRGIIAPGDTLELPYLEKDALANTLAAAITNRTLGDLVDLVRDRRHGESRVLLLPPLFRRRNRDETVKTLLDELAEDPELATEIAARRARWDKAARAAPRRAAVLLFPAPAHNVDG